MNKIIIAISFMVLSINILRADNDFGVVSKDFESLGKDFMILEEGFKKNINSIGNQRYKKENIDFSAQNIKYDAKKDIIVATGNVSFTSEGNKITADTLFYNIKTDVLYIKGNVLIENESGHKIYSKEAVFDPKINTGLIKEFKTIFSDKSLLQAETVDKKNEDTYNMKSMVFTPCKITCNYTPTWSIKSKTAVYDQTNSEIELYSAWLEVKGIPVLWSPYFAFSNLDFVRKPGFLTPSHEYNSIYGNVGIIPFYVPLSTHQDLTITTYAFLQSNTLVLADYRGEIEDGSFIASASVVDKQNHKREIDKDTRWHTFLYSKKNLTDVWRASLQIEEASDIYYLRNYNLNKKNKAESFYIDKLEFEGYFSQNSYFDTYAVKFTPVNVNLYNNDGSFENNNDSTNKVSTMNNNFNMNYTYLSDYYEFGRVNLFMNADNLFTKSGNQLSRLVTTMDYKYYYPTILGSYSFEALAQNVLYSDSVSNEKYVDDNSTTNIAAAITYEYPLLYEFKNFVYSISPIMQLSYARILDKNNNSFVIDSYSANINSNNLFELDNYQGFDKFQESKDFKYALKFSLLNETNHGSRIFIGQQFKTKVNDKFFNSINGDSASNYFVSAYLYPISNIYIVYNGVIDKSFSKVETSLSTGYNNSLLSVRASYDEYNNLDQTLYKVDRIAELTLAGAININKNFTVSTSYLFNIDKNYHTSKKSNTLNATWANECLEIIFYNTRDYYSLETANSWGVRFNMKSIDGYSFSSKA